MSRSFSGRGASRPAGVSQNAAGPGRAGATKFQESYPSAGAGGFMGVKVPGDDGKDKGKDYGGQVLPSSLP